MSEALIEFVDAMDWCWIDRRFEDLANYLAPDIVMVAPGGKVRLEGLDASVESYREFMARSEIRRYVTSDHVVTERGDTAVVEYSWSMSWDGGGSHTASGREVLVLARPDGGWRVVWRTQLPA